MSRFIVFRNERWIFVLLKGDCYERWGFSGHKLDFFSHLLSPKLAPMTQKMFSHNYSYFFGNWAPKGMVQ